MTSDESRAAKRAKRADTRTKQAPDLKPYEFEKLLTTITNQSLIEKSKISVEELQKLWISDPESELLREALTLETENLDLWAAALNRKGLPDKFRDVVAARATRAQELLAQYKEQRRVTP
jgi:hypothetical protein